VHPGTPQAKHLTDLSGSDHQRLRHVRRIRPEMLDYLFMNNQSMNR
jgi:hypothetical protein